MKVTPETVSQAMIDRWYAQEENYRLRLRAIGELARVCPPPDVFAGQTACPSHPAERWPCPLTKIAWYARGSDPRAEERALLEAIPLPDGMSGEE
ncbi:hypothetical protein [Nonomuraea sp. NPDC048826]|uniref:hypothetical protein n=1 Tax=Nonomuraea sp. NPDC048826 TaxID=3364347 RepID=UPI003714FDA2